MSSHALWVPMSKPATFQEPPTAVTVHAKSRILELEWPSGAVHKIPFELMRVYSPSAEVRGHGPGEGVLQTGKREIEIVSMAPVGNYAVQPEFSDGHNSGIYSWEYLHYLGSHEQKLWQDYERRLEAAGVDRDAPMKPALLTGHGHA